MKSIPRETDFIVVGAGVAGLRAAIELAEAGRVLVLAKRELSESATQYAQGGIAVALSDEDDIGLHLQDTLDAGDGLARLPERLPLRQDEGPRERLPVALPLQSCFPGERKLESARQADLRGIYGRGKLAGQDHHGS